MILSFKACYEFGTQCLCHCVIGSLVTLDLKITPMYSQRTCRNYYYLQQKQKHHQVNGTTNKKGKKALLDFGNPTIKHNKRLVFQK
jgi:hypothetical protein